ncbi:glycosyl hydrolase family 28 protein [Pluralibacter sp.]|uniref:glycoside hydrolase family 28 protein n=1 Tax=Pluralibacter sp. TaxID=1920032 RepID=UPI0025E48113|nr:glycosyl hydrolase family 28 protein [Pluralibacter sp.]MBV8043685.1 glycoside hydrolase family 28 protein [Pluralibacter sp.]
MDLFLSQWHPHADGITHDTAAFQQALDALAQAGGGRLVVEAGKYYVGGLLAGSNTCLWLSPGAELIVSDDYRDFTQATALSRAECSDRAFLYARDACNISICGGGMINGNADGWFSATADEMGYRTPAAQRPRIILLENCQQVRLENIVVRHAPMWTIHLVSCSQVFINGITVDNDLTMANTDALDIDSCQQVHITNSYFSAADDAICLKTTEKPVELQRPVRQVTISNCTLRSKSCAFKIGTETWQDIEDIVVSNCAIFGSNRGIGLVSRDGGRLRRMVFSAISFQCETAPACHWGEADPVFLSARRRDPQREPGEISQIQFRGMTGECEGAINLHSETPGRINRVLFDGIQITQRVSEHGEQGNYDIRPPCNPLSPTGMGMDNAWCLNPQTGQAWGVEPYPGGLPVLYARGVSGLTLLNMDYPRPSPLPHGWNAQAIYLENDGKEARNV